MLADQKGGTPMARKDMTNVTVLDPLANRVVLDEFPCAGCGSHKGKLEAIGRSGRFWVICAECGLFTIPSDSHFSL
jgi:hypothetical protein